MKCKFNIKKKRVVALVIAAISALSLFPGEAFANEVKTLDSKSSSPELYADVAVLMEASSGTVLYDKGMDEKMYPASITKIMTTYLAIENSSMMDTVTYSHYAIFSLEAEAANIAMKVNEQITMKDTLYGVMLASANECANAAAEHVGKNLPAYSEKLKKLVGNGESDAESKAAIESFVDLMNDTAKEAGAKNTHFNNPSGLFDENHYTSAYDMAMITRKAIKNETFLKIEANHKYTIGETAMTNEPRYIRNRHSMMHEDEAVYYEGIIAGKTGYVDQSGNTLVTVAKKDDMTLISVVMKSDSEHVYNDTKLLLDYGFENYHCENIAKNETKFSLSKDDSFGNIGSVFPEDSTLLKISEDSFVIMPNKAKFEDLKSEISFEEELNGSNSVAKILYYYRKHKVGEASLDVVKKENEREFTFTPVKQEEKVENQGSVKNFRVDLRIVAGILVIILVLLIILKYILNSRKKGSRHQIRKERHGRSHAPKKDRNGASEFGISRRDHKRSSVRPRRKKQDISVHHKHRYKD